MSTCKCVNSKCLVLYCECYRQGITCNDDCTCIDCKNTKEHASYATAANGGAASAFRKPASHRDYTASNARLAMEASAQSKFPALVGHRDPMRSDAADKGNGCNCKNSKCLKKYCICYNAQVECGAGRCRCTDCRNPHGAISRALSSAAAPPRRGAGAPAARAPAGTRCKCAKTECLKLYCDCFRQDLVCNSDCDCVGCKNTEGDSGPTGARTRAKEEIMKTRPGVFQTPKKKSGVGCSCVKNKCLAKYCDCNTRGVGCDPKVCTCINCENMMAPNSEMPEKAFEQENEEQTEVFIIDHVKSSDSRIKGLQNFSHMINKFEERRISNPSAKCSSAYSARKSAAEAAKTVMEEEAVVRIEIEGKIKELESELAGKVEKEHEALENYRQKTSGVMCLEMEEPCRWNTTYQQLKEYVMKTGDLPPVPSACTTEVDRRLSIWVQEHKSLVYSKSERIVSVPHRIEALESLGIEWIVSSEERWNKMYESLAAYKRQHKTVILPSFMQCRRSKDKDLSALRHWIDLQDQEVTSGAMAKRRDRLKKLQDLGLPLKLTWEQEWKYQMEELLKYRAKYGHLIMSSSSDHSDLNVFATEVLSRLKKGSKVKLTADEMYDLRSKGLLDDLKKGPGRPVPFGNQTERMKLIPLERVKEVNYWAGMLEQLKAYQAEHGTLEFPVLKSQGIQKNWAGHAYAHLRDWVEVQQNCYQNQTLEESRIAELSKLGLELDPWNNMFKKLKKYAREGGTARLPKEFKSPDGEVDEELDELCKWVHEQIRLYRRGELDSDRKKKLRELGVKLTKGNLGKMPWEETFEAMMEYYYANKSVMPKRNGPLRQWVLELIDLMENGYVSNRRQHIIDSAKIGPHLRNRFRNKKRKAASSDDGSDKKVKTVHV